MKKITNLLYVLAVLTLVSCNDFWISRPNMPLILKQP